MNPLASTARNSAAPRTLLVLALAALASNRLPAATVTADLSPLHDATRVLVNPHKGWYHHYPDNHPDKYRIARDEDLLEFPGMDHLYLRLAWAYLEPREGEFNWAFVEPLIAKWTAHGLGIAFRISCKETSTDRPEQQFATPRWVKEAGTRGGFYRMGQPTGPEGPWEPYYGDPIFLAKLDRFLAAFAARFDGRPEVRYVDIGSIGDWGEGHTWAGSRTEPGLVVRKQHVDLHLRHFKRTPLVISDDFVYALRDPGERRTLHEHILAHRISYRDDSILVDGYLPGHSGTFTVRSAELFAEAHLQTPTVLELEHYGTVKQLGNWDARPGSSLARHGRGRAGPDFFRGALELLRATYIGYHGYAREWLADNPALTRELLNRCGYWLFPLSLERPAKLVPGQAASFRLRPENRGVAPPYHPYELRLKLATPGRARTVTVGRAGRTWLPGKPIEVRWTLTPPADLPAGKYSLAMGLFDATGPRERPVEFALKESVRDAAGFFTLDEVELAAPAASRR